MTVMVKPEAVEKAMESHIKVMRSIAVNIPDPGFYAAYLPEKLAGALRSAWRRGRDEWCVTPFDAELLRPYGLCCYRNYTLTAFGMKVRRALVGSSQ